jgi:hypothetical protein
LRLAPEEVGFARGLGPDVVAEHDHIVVLRKGAVAVEVDPEEVLFPDSERRRL